MLQVLSKHQASITFRDGKFYLKDVGSSNGTFVNNFRLSKCGVESEEVSIYTEDVLRSLLYLTENISTKHHFCSDLVPRLNQKDRNLNVLFVRLKSTILTGPRDLLDPTLTGGRTHSFKLS